MNLGMPEMIFIFLLALLIFGPRKLPEVGRQIGKALAEFKRASNTFKSQLDMEMRNLELEENAKKPAAPTIQPPEHTIGTDSAIPPRVDPDSYAASESVTPLPGDPGTQPATDSGTPLPADSAAHIVADSATPPPPGTAMTPGDETASAKAADA